MKTLLFISLLFGTFVASGQDTSRTYSITKTSNKISIDGELSDEEWSTIPKTTSLHQKWPVDTALAQNQAEIRITYDDKFLYFGIKCYDKGPQVLTTLKRDNGFWSSDAIGISLDPQNQQNNGYFFGVTSYANQIDGLIENNDINDAWDTKWYAESKRTDEYWTVEIAIPFSSIRFPKEGDWGINFVHSSVQRNMYSVWEKIPRTLSIVDLGYMGKLKWDKTLNQKTSSFTVNPYVKFSRLNDQENNKIENKPDGGVDARVVVTSGTNLDITYNPDFSQVDVDQQQINLSQFNLFFPEKRPFFLENSDIFTSYGSWNVRPFYSRTIGMRDGNPSPILYGLRYTGNATKKLRFGIMNTQTQKNGDVLGQNFSMISLQQRFWKRSSITGMISNVQDVKEQSLVDTTYGRNAGVELFVNSKDNKYKSSFKFHKSQTNDLKDDNHFYSFAVSHNGERLGAVIEVNGLGSDFSTGMGLSLLQWHHNATDDTWNKEGYDKVWTQWYYYYFPKKGPIATHYPVFSMDYLHYTDGKLGLRHSNFWWGFEFKNRRYLELWARNRFNRILYPVNFTGGEDLPAGKYEANDFKILYNTDDRKKIKFSTIVEYGQFYNGMKTSVSEQIDIRFQPFLNLGFGVQYNNIDLPQEYGDAELYLATSTVQFNFSKTLFWTNYLQYNTQASNFNINSRFQWRFSPLSDVFVIFSNNYLDNPIQSKNTSLVTRVNYVINF